MVKRNTTIRDRHRRMIARTKPPCYLCGLNIDFSLKYPDPMCFVVDHVTPLARGGADTIENKRAAHHSCNSQKRARLIPTQTRQSNTFNW